jgi:hypothetical protein
MVGTRRCTLLLSNLAFSQYISNTMLTPGHHFGRLNVGTLVDSVEGKDVFYTLRKHRCSLVVATRWILG